MFILYYYSVMAKSSDPGIPSPVKPPRRKRSKGSVSSQGDKEEDAQINEIIEEILKTTPDPSMSLRSRRSSISKEGRKPMSKDDLEKALNKSQVGWTGCFFGMCVCVPIVLMCSGEICQL